MVCEKSHTEKVMKLEDLYVFGSKTQLMTFTKSCSLPNTHSHVPSIF